MTLVPVDTTSALAVSDYLDKARQWLATAVEMTGPAEIAMAKAEIATAAEATKQLNLSRDIQTDAQEMVRRAEFALGKAIRLAQADGEIATRADSGWTSRNLQERGETLKTSTNEFFSSSQQRQETYALSDGVEPERFETALGEAKDEGNLSRANVLRKLHKQATPVAGPERSPELRIARADLIRDLAAQGYSSRQMPAKVGVAEAHRLACAKGTAK